MDRNYHSSKLYRPVVLLDLIGCHVLQQCKRLIFCNEELKPIGAYARGSKRSPTGVVKSRTMVIKLLAIRNKNSAGSFPSEEDSEEDYPSSY